MTLPELPKGKKRTEAKIDGRVAAWVEKHHPRSALLEVKMKGGKLKEHQKRLIDTVAKTGKFKYKFPDGRTRTPLDYVVLKDADVLLAECDEKGNCELTINNLEPSLNIKV